MGALPGIKNLAHQKLLGSLSHNLINIADLELEKIIL